MHKNFVYLNLCVIYRMNMYVAYPAATCGGKSSSPIVGSVRGGGASGNTQNIRYETCSNLQKNTKTSILNDSGVTHSLTLQPTTGKSPEESSCR